MINLRSEIVQALENNQVLFSVVGNRIHQITNDENNKKFPYITYFELSNRDSDYVDDEVIASDITFQISIWSKAPAMLVIIAEQIDKTMKAIGFRRIFSTDLYEDDTKIFHRPMRYTTKREVL